MSCDHTKLYVTDSTMRSMELYPCLWCQRDALAAELAEARAAQALYQYPPEHRVSVAEARVQALQQKIESWLHDGHMQTFADRERIRAEMRACLTSETEAK